MQALNTMLEDRERGYCKKELPPQTAAAGRGWKGDKRKITRNVGALNWGRAGNGCGIARKVGGRQAEVLQWVESHGGITQWEGAGHAREQALLAWGRDRPQHPAAEAVVVHLSALPSSLLCRHLGERPTTGACRPRPERAARRKKACSRRPAAPAARLADAMPRLPGACRWRAGPAAAWRRCARCACRSVLAGADVLGQGVERGGLGGVVRGQHALGLLNQLVSNLRQTGESTGGVFTGGQGVGRARGGEAGPGRAGSRAHAESAGWSTHKGRLCGLVLALGASAAGTRGAPRASAPGRPARGMWSWLRPGPCQPSCPAPRWWR